VPCACPPSRQLSAGIYVLCHCRPGLHCALFPHRGIWQSSRVFFFADTSARFRAEYQQARPCWATLTFYYPMYLTDTCYLGRHTHTNQPITRTAPISSNRSMCAPPMQDFQAPEIKIWLSRSLYVPFSKTQRQSHTNKRNHARFALTLSRVAPVLHGLSVRGLLPTSHEIRHTYQGGNCDVCQLRPSSRRYGLDQRKSLLGLPALRGLSFSPCCSTLLCAFAVLLLYRVARRQLVRFCASGPTRL
jgi:hypothetical protein